jgi:O-acetyl-ADP-ribose deacetylase (regulator of RNase III)
MNLSEKRAYLINELLKENSRFKMVNIPEDEEGQRRLLRSLMNVRFAAPISDKFMEIQDEYLQEINESRGIVEIDELEEKDKDLYVWQGDITRLKAGAIVNAANSGMTGCYSPCHACIDNCIHTYAGIQLRNYCQNMMDELAKEHGGIYEEPTGMAKITPAFNLPCDYVIHTVGPIVQGRLNEEHERLLASCYQSCLELAEASGIGSIVFCCISTGVFMFPNQRAAEIAVETVRQYKENTKSNVKVIFNVFKDLDKELYENLLG